MPNLLSPLTKTEWARLFEELNDMNLEEIRGFCSVRGIPYRIVAEYPNRQVKAARDTDRKPIVLARLRRDRPADRGWKALRKAKAKSALGTLARIAPVERVNGQTAPIR